MTAYYDVLAAMIKTVKQQQHSAVWSHDTPDH